MSTNCIRFLRRAIALSLIVVLTGVNAAASVALSVLCQDGVKVFVDDKPKGFAPLTLRDLPVDQRFSIRLELPGHETIERSFTLEAGRVETWETELLPLYPGFELTTLPGAEIVAINQQGVRVRLGITDEKGVISSDGKISGESCSLEISKDGYITKEEKVTLDLRNKVKVAVTLRPKSSRAKILSVPAVTEAYLNTVKHSLNQGLLEVPPDTEVSVEVRLEGYTTKSEKIKVGKGQEQVVNFGNLDAIRGGVRVAVVTEKGPVSGDFYAKARIFVDSREVQWNRGAAIPLSPGKREFILMHELYNVMSDSPAAIDVTENVVSDITFRVELRPSRIRIAVQARDRNGQPLNSLPSYAMQLDDKPLERNGDDTYDVPSGREFVVAITANQFLPVRRTFSLLPGEEAPLWTAVLEWDRPMELAALRASLESERAALRASFESEQAALAQELTRHQRELESFIRRSQRFTAAKHQEHRKWLDGRTYFFEELKRKYRMVLAESPQLENSDILKQIAENKRLLAKIPTPVPIPPPVF